MAAHGRWTPSPSFLLELQFEPPDNLVLLLDEEVLSPDLIQVRVFVFVKVDLMVGLRSGPCRLFTQLGD